MTQEIPKLNLGSDTILCEGEKIEIGESQTGYTYLWNTNATTGMITIESEGAYILEKANTCGVDIDTIDIEMRTRPIIELASAYTICDNQPLVINIPVGEFEILWSTGSSEHSIAINEAGQYSVTLSNFCFEEEKEIDVEICIRESNEIYMPGVFTPNNDGINEIFKPFMSATNQESQVSRFEIYDRWGELLHKEANKSISEIQGWNGSFKQRGSIQGIYVYYLEIKLENEKRQVSGEVLLMK